MQLTCEDGKGKAMNNGQFCLALGHSFADSYLLYIIMWLVRQLDVVEALVVGGTCFTRCDLGH